MNVTRNVTTYTLLYLSLGISEKEKLLQRNVWSGSWSCVNITSSNSWKNCVNEIKNNGGLIKNKADDYVDMDKFEKNIEEKLKFNNSSKPNQDININDDKKMGIQNG